MDRSDRRRVESAWVGREQARIGPHTLQGGAILREARHTSFPLRAGRQEATHLQRLLGRHHQLKPREGLVGVPTGKGSGLLVLDVDPRDGGPESLAALERENGPLPETARARTGGGGVHVFFRYPAEKEVRNSAGWLGLGLDVRGEGGYVVVPPSRTQGPYEWIDRSRPVEAAWLVERLSEHEEETLF